MIVLDTKVQSVSALMRKAPDSLVVEWLDQQPAKWIWTKSISLLEARLGLVLLPAGRRRNALESPFEELLVENLEERFLDFDRPAGG